MKNTKVRNRTDRYCTIKRDEKPFNFFVREMLEMISNEKVKSNLYINGVKLSNHAKQRISERLGIENEATALRYVKDLLKKATYLGTIISSDGRTSVLYYHGNTAIHLSPNLKTVVSVALYNSINHTNRCFVMLEEDGIYVNRDDKAGIIEIFNEHLKIYRRKEEELESKILQEKNRLDEANKQYESILKLKKNIKNKKNILELLADNNYKMKLLGKDLFYVKKKKKIFMKAIVELA